MQLRKFLIMAIVFLDAFVAQAQEITMQKLLKEMANKTALAEFPDPAYASMQASSYNRASTARDAPGWFADSDGTGFIRIENINGKQEWVVMEHNGPGAITKMWAPDFYYGGIDDLDGPQIKIYLDRADKPVISENYFKLITGRGTVPSPYARSTARAGDCYLPIPFAKSCKITFDKKSFYHIINYRAYPPRTVVKTFTKQDLKASLPLMDKISQQLFAVYSADTNDKASRTGVIAPDKTTSIGFIGQGAISQFEIQLDPGQIAAHPELLRSVVLTGEFDGEQTVWVPLGDFFGSANALNPFQTWTRTVNSFGQMVCTWVMPFRKSAKLTLKNLSNVSINISKFEIKKTTWHWDRRSMHFHANWRNDDLVQGSTFSDWNFIDIKGKGVFVGDAWTVLNPDFGWWGEGDEKIYADDAWSKKFPTQFGTGTEDYYGWAGGENPSKDDVFSHPFLANIVVGSATKRRRDVRGFNICTRIRSMDAIPFNRRFVFDMEASPGVDIRNPWNYLAYSAVVFWYGVPGAASNRPSLPVQAARPITTLNQLDSLAVTIKKKQGGTPGAIEVQNIRMTFSSSNITGVTERPVATENKNKWNRGDHLLVSSPVPGESITFTITEQFVPADLKIQLTKKSDYSIIQLFVNGTKAGEPVDLSATEEPVTSLIDLGIQRPVNNELNIQLKFIGKNIRVRNVNYCAGVDFVRVDKER